MTSCKEGALQMFAFNSKLCTPINLAPTLLTMPLDCQEFSLRFRCAIVAKCWPVYFFVAYCDDNIYAVLCYVKLRKTYLEQEAPSFFPH